MKRTCFLCLMLTAVLAGGCNKTDNGRDRAAATPGGSGTVGTSGAADVSSADKDFVEDVAVANMAEMDAARMAQQKGMDANVKKFAQMMLDDHGKAGDQLKTLASRHHIEMPAQIDDKHKEQAEDLGKKTGADFDRAYADAMVDGHQDFVDKLESRIDKENLADWKTKHVDPGTGKKVEAKGEAITVMPEKSDNPVTASINQWAADTYPVAFAHLEAAKALQKGAKRRTTTP